MYAAHPNPSRREALDLPIPLPLGGAGITTAIIGAPPRRRARPRS